METDPKESANFRMMTEMMNRNILQFAFDVPMVEILAWDATTLKIVAMNAQALAISGQSQRQAIQKTITDIFGGVSPDRMARFINKLRVRQGQEDSFRIQHADANGQPKFSRVVVRYLAEPRPTVVAFVQNITR